MACFRAGPHTVEIYFSPENYGLTESNAGWRVLGRHASIAGSRGIFALASCCVPKTLPVGGIGVVRGYLSQMLFRNLDGNA